MGLRLPLFGKIAGWAVLNLVVIGAVFLSFHGDRLRLNPQSQLAGKAGQRLDAVGSLVIEELSQSPRANWDDRLIAFGKQFDLTFILSNVDGERMAGPAIEYPKVVLSKILERPMRFAVRPKLEKGANPTSRNESIRSSVGIEDLPPHERPRGYEGPIGGTRSEGNPELEELMGALRAEELAKFGSSPPPRAPRARQVERITGPIPKFVIHDRQHAGHWWYGLRLPVWDVQRTRPYPTVLLATSETLSPVFFDSANWWPTALAAIFISVALWFPFVKRMTRSLSEMTEATEAIADGDFEVSVRDRQDDELGRLGGAIGRMATRLSGYVTGQRRFLGDTAHELCSPLARMQMAVGILEAKASAEQLGYVEDISEEVQHMSGLVNELLSFSKASLRPKDIRLEQISLLTIVERAVKREAHGQTEVKVSVDQSLIVLANEQLLGRAIGNLLRNAVRYAGHAGPIGVKAEVRHDSVFVVVWDSGPGISEKHLTHIFDPFYRPDVSRTSTTGGVGLGMAIVKTCVESCGGVVRCRNRDSGGLKVMMKLRGGDASDPTSVTKSDFEED
jgi:two-component system, OmpR family, sensor histidine kinase CpxA